MFYHLCYEGAVDLAAITDLNDRLALEVQITEFGQVPKQLFSRPHPPRSRSYGLYGSARLNARAVEGSQNPRSNDDQSNGKLFVSKIPNKVTFITCTIEVAFLTG